MEHQSDTPDDTRASYLVTFYLGEAQDAHGRYIHEIQGWSHDRLEAVHNYIQWLFPTTRRGVDPTAPLVSQADMRVFRSDERLQKAVLRSLHVMLGFYGFRIDSTAGSITISRAETWKARKPHWVTRGNHNFLRLTRILTTLRLFGMDDHASALFAVLNDVYHTESKDVIGSTTYRYWKQAAEGSD